MRIAHVVPVYPPRRGGMGQVAYEYTERLRARGHSVHVFTPRYADAPTATVPDYVHRVRPPVHFGNAAALPSLLWQLAPFDLIHLHYPFYGGAEPVAWRK